MKIQYRIALAQLPALVVLAVFWGLAQIALGSLGDASERILHENYRSVLAAQRMMEAAERLDSAALVRLAGRPDQADALIAAHRPVLEAELAVAEANITEEGEAEALAELRRRWGVYSADYQHFLSAPPDQRTSLYFDRLYPEFHALKEEANGILSLNQDAMVRKSDLAVTEAGRLRRQATLAGLVGLITAALAGLWAGTRLGEPYRRLSAAAERVAEGDLNLQVKEAGDLESIQVAHAFNRMISRLRAYRRASETEMVRTREAAQAAIDSLLDPVVVLAPGGELRLANRAARSLFDLAADARSLAGVHEALRLAIRKLAQRVEREGQAQTPQDYESVLVTTDVDGERAWLPHAVPMLDPATAALIGVTVLLQDVTRLRRLDQLKGDLVHTVAHELRTPLTSLGMALHLCLDPRVSGPLPERMGELLTAAREDVRRLKTLVDDLLDLSRIQEGHMALRDDRFRAGELVGEVAATWAGAAQAQGVYLKTELCEVPVFGDRARLVVALGNLVSNAVRLSPTGAEVWIGAGPVEGGLRFWVDDAGPGVPEGDRERVFARFEGGGGGGAGLGLYIAREIVTAHHGKVGIERSPAGGARVWMELPDRSR